MAVNVSKLWRNGRYQSLSRDAKLLYIYLVTSPDLNTLGLLNTSLISIKTDVTMSEPEFRAACKELNKSFVEIFVVDGQPYFFIPVHFSTLAKSVATSRKANKDLAKLPEDVVKAMHSLGLMPDIEKHVEFNPPTEEEIEAYALSKGHLVEAKTVIEFYEGKAKLFNKKGWYDSKGKAVKDWRAKLRNIWFKDENKLKECADAPKGFEFFFVKDGEAGNITPDYWKNGLPYSNDGFLHNKILQREYKEKASK